MPELQEQISHHQLSEPTVKNTHNWKQRGNHIACDSCESQHGFILQPGQQLVGIDEKGLPRIVKVWI